MSLALEHKYRLEIGGITIADTEILSISGVNTAIEIVEQKVTDPTTGDTVTEKIPGRPVCTDVVLIRAVTSNDLGFWKWHTDIMNGKDTRADCSIFVQDETHSDIACWVLESAWPSKVEIAGLSSEASNPGVLKETVTLSHSGITRVECP